MKNFLSLAGKNQKGQAVLEYVLLLLVIFIVSVSIMIGLSQSTQRLFNNYYGEYFACLLELGELPSLGNDQNPETECDELYQSFTFTDGRPPISGGIGGVGSTDGNSNDGSSSGGSSAGSSGSAGAASGGGGGSGYSSSTGGFGFNSGRSRRVPLSSADRGGTGEEDGDLGGPSGYYNFQQSGDLDGSGSGRSRYVPIYGYVPDLEDEKAQEAPVLKAENLQDSEESLRGRKVPASINKKDVNDVESDEEMTFPDFIRMLIMAAIILVILIFFGGQVMQYQKSKD